MTDSHLSRRQLLQLGAAAGAATMLPAGLRPSLARADANVRTAWIPSGENPIVRRASYDGNTNETVSFVTLMRVADKPISNRRAGWYLWHWTHPTNQRDAVGNTVGGAYDSSNICRLYGSSTPWRGWTEIGVGNFPTPSGWSYDRGHLESGDVVWDPATGQFICTPHSLLSGSSPATQNTHLYTSADGFNWTYQGGPILSHGTSDGKHIVYGLFLRDLSGNLVRLNGKADWYYNGREHDGSRVGFCRLHLAETSNPASASGWTKAYNNPLKNPHSGGLFELGSALYTNNRVWLFSAGNYAQVMYHDQARYDGNPYLFNGGPGLPFYSSGDLMGAPSYHADTARHFIAHAALPAPVVARAGGRFEVDLLVTAN